MHFNSVLRDLRKKKSMTQGELAAALGVSESTIGMYERGQREPNFETLETIADYFNVDMDYLTGRTCCTTKIVSEPATGTQPGSGEAVGLDPARRAFVDRVKAWDDITFHRIVAVVDAVLGEK